MPLSFPSSVPFPRTIPDNIAYNDNDTALSAPPSLCFYITSSQSSASFSSEDTLIRVRVLKSKLYSRGWLAHHPQSPARTHHCAGHDDRNNLDYIVWSCNFSHGETEEVVVLDIYSQGVLWRLDQRTMMDKRIKKGF